MLILLGDEHKDHLAYLSSVGEDVVQEFCKLALNSIRNGANPKVFGPAAQKLNVPASTVRDAVDGLVFLLVESSKLHVTEVDFLDSVMVLAYAESLNKLLLATYLQNRADIRKVTGEMALGARHYHDLEWRLNVQLHSRQVRHQAAPSVLLKLHTDGPGGKEEIMLQSDPRNIVHVHEQLEAALKEARTAHSRRIMRHIK